MSARLEIGENRVKRFGVPTWAGEWPVTVDGREVAVIVETERGYRLREGGRWADPERGCRSQAEGDARNRFLTWATMNGHPASETRYQETEVNGRTWARVVVENAVTFGPDADTDRVYAEYRRLYAEYLKKEGVE